MKNDNHFDMNEHIKEDERRTYFECLVRCVKKKRD